MKSNKDFFGEKWISLFYGSYESIFKICYSEISDKVIISKMVMTRSGNIDYF